MVDKVGGYMSTQLADGTFSSRSILRIYANEANFLDGTIMRVRCTAFIVPDLYWKTSEVVVKLPRPSTHQQLPFKTANSSSSNYSYFVSYHCLSSQFFLISQFCSNYLWGIQHDLIILYGYTL